MTYVHWLLQHPLAQVPQRAHRGDACFDLCAVEEAIIAPITLHDTSEHVPFKPYTVRNTDYHGYSAIVSTGLVVQLPTGWELQVRPRSGLMFKHGLTCHWGTVDEGFRKPDDILKVLLINLGDKTYHVKPGDRIAQAIFAPVLSPNYTTYSPYGSGDSLILPEPTATRTGGYGSSGK